MLISHLGRPNGEPNPNYSLKPCQTSLANILGKPVTFLDNCIGSKIIKKCANLRESEIILLENLRFHPEETLTGNKKKDKLFQN